MEQYYTNRSEQTSRNRDLQSYDTITNVAAFIAISIFFLLWSFAFHSRLLTKLLEDVNNGEAAQVRAYNDNSDFPYQQSLS